MKEVALPNILTPETTFFKHRLSREVLSLYEQYQEQNRKFPLKAKLIEFSGPDYDNYRLLCSRLTN